MDKNKRKKKKGKQAPAPAPQPTQRPAQQKRPVQRASSGVPPADAFDNLRRLPPPDLPGPGRGEAREQVPYLRAADGGKKKKPRPAQQEEAPPPKKKRKQKTVNPVKLRRRRRLAAILVVVLLIGGGVLLSVNLLFNIQKFDVQGESPYTVDEIAAAFGPQVGDAMYGFSAGGAEDRIKSALPYIETISVRRRLPSTVVFRVTSAEEGYAIPWDGGYAVLSTQRKVLRQAGEAPGDLVLVNGLQEVVVVPGQPLALTEEAAAAAPADDSGSGTSNSEADASTKDEDTSAEKGAEGEEGTEGGEGEGEEAEPPPEKTPEKQRAGTPAECFAAMDTLLTALEKIGLEGVDWIDVTDPLEMKMHWDGRITVELGPRSNMDEKLETMVVLLTDDTQELIGKEDTGVLDMSYYIATGRSYFEPT